MSAFDDYYDYLPYKVRRDFYGEDFRDDDEDPTWEEIKWAPGYFVSRFGDVMSTHDNGKPHILRTWPNQYGHRYVGIAGRKVSVHRLVAEAFLYNDENYPVVRHLNDDPEDNYVENLAWGTQMDNVMDCRAHNRDFKKPVYCYELDTEFRSCADAAEYFGVSRGLITMCCKGQVHSIRGNHLCYLEDLDDRLEKLDSWISKNGNYKRVIAINPETGEQLIFNSRKEAS